MKKLKDDNYDACKTANIKISGRQNLVKWALTCFGGSTHERLLGELVCPYMVAYYLSAMIDCAYFYLMSKLRTFAQSSIKVHMSRN
jgi:hypothetical protein